MAAKPVTIRNLTSTPIELRHVERFPPPEKKGGAHGLQSLAKNLTRTVASLATNVTRADKDAEPLPANARPFETKGVRVRVEPFGTVKTDIKTFVNNDKERLRLTFEVEGERHQITVPVPTVESAEMKALKDKPRFRFTGIFVTLDSHLAIFSSARLNAWMEELRDDLLLSSLSIPGTHNTPTCHVAAPSVRCQAVSPREQLENGVRFFDVRVQPQYPDDPNKDELVLVHSAFPIALTGNKYFRELLRDIEDFLRRNPSETLILSLKREGTGKATDEQLSRILRDHYAKPGSNWYTEPRVPTLGEVRGRIVLIRRFNLEDRLKKAHNGRRRLGRQHPPRRLPQRRHLHPGLLRGTGDGEHRQEDPVRQRGPCPRGESAVPVRSRGRKEEVPVLHQLPQRQQLLEGPDLAREDCSQGQSGHCRVPVQQARR